MKEGSVKENLADCYLMIGYLNMEAGDERWATWLVIIMFLFTITYFQVVCKNYYNRGLKFVRKLSKKGGRAKHDKLKRCR